MSQTVQTRRTVGELLASIEDKMGIKTPTLPKEATNRLISDPPEVIADEKNQIFKIKLDDGRYLNIHVVQMNAKNVH